MSAAHRRRELAAVSAGLEHWLRQRPHYAQARVVRIERPAGAGLSNETFLFDCEIGDRREALVMQIGPAAAGLFRDYDLAVMARVQQRLRDVSSVPVADIKWYEADASLLGAPFYVMTKVAGRVPSDNPAYHASGWFAESSAHAQSAAWSSGIAALCALHAIDPLAQGFEFVCTAPWGMPLDADPARQRIRQWREFFAWGARAPITTIERALDTLEANAPSPPARLVICWGDAKISNCVIEDSTVRALLDWELCGLSDPHDDLAHWLLLDWAHWRAQGVPRLAGLPSPQATVAAYEAQTGRAMPHVLWWFQLNLVRLAIIYHRFLERRIDLGRLDHQADLLTLNPMCALLDEALTMKELP